MPANIMIFASFMLKEQQLPLPDKKIYARYQRYSTTNIFIHNSIKRGTGKGF